MGRQLPVDVRIAVAVAAGGRCSYRGCNKLLTEHDLTKVRGKFSAYAHIVASSPNGPRGDAVKSKELEKDPGNIMLLCADCHRLIDVDDRDGHPVEKLLAMKREHEERIAKLTAIGADRRTRLLLVSAKIGDRAPQLVEAQAKLVLAQDADPRYVHDEVKPIQLEDREQYDHEADYWREQGREIRRRVEALLTRPSPETPKHLSVFAIAPIPLLVLLGHVLGDLQEVDVFMLSREPKGWAWPNDRSAGLEWIVREPPPEVDAADDVGLFVGLSGRPDPAPSDLELQAAFHLMLSNPGLDSLRSRADLSEFRQRFREVLTRIQDRFGANVCVHLFAVVPNAAAIEMGRVRLPKVAPQLVVYDYNHKTKGWREALRIGGPQQDRANGQREAT